MKRARRRRAICVTLFAAVLYGYWSYAHSGSLLARSRRLGYIGHPDVWDGRVYDLPWGWLDSHTVIWCRPTVVRSPAGPRQTSQSVRSVDVSTGAERSLDKIARHLQPTSKGNTTVGSHLMLYSRATTPDGKWFIAEQWTVTTVPSRTQTRKLIAISSDGSTVRTVYDGPTEPWGMALIMPDGRHWLTIPRYSFVLDRGIVRPLAGGNDVRSVSITPGVSGNPVPLGWLKDGNLLLGDWDQKRPVMGNSPSDLLRWREKPIPLRTVRLDLSRSTCAPVEGKVAPPANGRIVRHVALSPAGDKLAFLTFVPAQADSFATRVSRWMPRLLPPSAGQIELWMTELDGSNPKLLGSRPATPDDANAWSIHDRCAWSPDGKRIAFTCEHHLWCVEAR